MQGQELQGTSRDLVKKFGDLDIRIGHLESEAEKAINGAGCQFPWLLRSNLLNLPSEDLLNDVIVYLNDSDRFRLRGLNIPFTKLTTIKL
eukprot:TRINITY_DN6981_c0_g1_i1.p1 TRINITY_DN6981_c0_g1~~TRINITY_DN6981_c0_g1_i1.p1  ORF type:complete len:90 (-),score=11.43 TRINITY_DN6981_c0_g1_i1:69-338(-)